MSVGEDDAGAGDRLDSAREIRYGEFVSLLARHDQSIRCFVRSLLPTQDGVDDVLQETALECWKKFADFQSETNDSTAEFVRWACVIARFKALSWQRDQARDRLVFRDSVVELLAKTELPKLDQRERERQAIENCLAHLANDQRRLVLSVHAPGESVAKIAEETGIRARKLYSKVNNLRRVLLECLQNQLSHEVSHG